jgi:GNAT superfamily N-acetyltransferase
VLDEWRGSDLDLAEDARVAETPDGGIVAYVVVRRPGTLTAVHPDHEGRGIGTRLLDWDVVRDAVSLHALDARSFATNPGYAAESLREFCEEHLEAHAFDASLSRVAEEGEDIVGFLIARRWEDEAVGYVDLLAADPDHL